MAHGGGPARADDPPGAEQPPAREAPQRPESQDLAGALERVQQRWAEVNRGIVEARESTGRNEQRIEQEEEDEAEEPGSVQSFPDPSRYESPAPNGNSVFTPRFSPASDSVLTSKALDPAEPLGLTEVAVSGAGRRQAAIRYQSFAMALSDPHQTTPVIDVFV
jgi:hypothetical protein